MRISPRSHGRAAATLVVTGAGTLLMPVPLTAITVLKAITAPLPDTEEPF